MEAININGEDYVKASDVKQAPKWDGFDHVCVIADRGWIFEGYRDLSRAGFCLADAHVVRRWDNGLGIGGLAKPEHKDDYTLDEIGRIVIAERAVIAEIPLEW